MWDMFSRSKSGDSGITVADILSGDQEIDDEAVPNDAIEAALADTEEDDGNNNVLVEKISSPV